ncbi:hypothetical protein Btru_065979 [Bulinus truncatus]|nr:hypothetical protein Btru_065979 [Bulinus truncatus]
MPDPDVVMPGNDVVMPGPDVVMPGPDVVMPGNDVVMPGNDVVMPGNDVVMPGNDVVMPGNDVVMPGPDVVMPGNDTRRKMLRGSDSSGGQLIRNGVHSKTSYKNKQFQLDGWILAWFFMTAVVCTWDASFIMLRPYSLPGGSLAFIWYLYKYYIPVDQRYGDIQDDYVFAQSLLNYVEVIINIVTIVLHYRRSSYTTITAFTVTVMTFWKTVLYFLMFSEFCAGDTYRKGNTALQEFFLVVIPNGVWIVVPLFIMYSLWNKLIPEIHNCLVQNISSGKSQTNESFEHVTYASKKLK